MGNLSHVALRASIVAATAWVILPASSLDAQTHSFQQVVVTAGTSCSAATGDNETVECTLADGTSVIVSPGSRVTVETTADGSITVNVSSGLVRVAGGSSNAARPITIVTPQARMELRAGAAIVEAADGLTRAHLIVGEGLVVTSGGVSRLLYRPGFEVATDGGTPTQPRRMTQQEIVNDVMRLSVGLSDESLPQVLSNSDGTLGETWDSITQAIVAGSVPGAGEAEGVASGTGPDTEYTQLNSAPDQGRDNPIDENPIDKNPIDKKFSFDLAGTFGTFGGVGGSVGATAETVDEQNTVTFDTNLTTGNQQFPNGSFFSSENEVYLGPTTNKLFSASNLTVKLGDSIKDGEAPFTSLKGLSGDGVIYYYGSATDGIQSKASKNELEASGFVPDQGLVRLQDLALGRFKTYSFHYDTLAGGWSASTTFGDQAPSRDPFATPVDRWYTGKGVEVLGLNFGTTIAPDDTETPVSSLYKKDSFIFLDMNVMEALNWEGEPGQSYDRVELQQKLANYGVTVPYEIQDNANFSIDDPDQYGVAGAAFLIDDPTETRRYIFATGGLDEVIAHPTPGHVVDYFHLSAGIEKGDFVNGIDNLTPGMFTGNGSRAFQRAETWTGLATAGFSLAIDDTWRQTPFMIVNPDAPLIGTGSLSPKLLYADVGFAEDANGLQVSSISAAIGEVEFRLTDELNGGNPALGNQKIVDAILRFRSVGSSSGVDDTGSTLSSLLVTSDFESTAAGGGNPNLGSNTVPDPGRLGFFVVENAGQIFDDVAQAKPELSRLGTLAGGAERAIGSTETTGFAALRLGVATGSAPVSANRWQVGSEVVGYASAILEGEMGIGVTLVAFGAVGGDNTFLDPNLRFYGFDDAANTFQATIGTLALGGPGGLSAYVDDSAYGARTDPVSGSDVALIAGPMVAKAIVDKRSANAGQKSLSKSTAHYKHVKWGFFFGDTKTTEGQREHAHMGSFAAGDDLTQAEIKKMDSLTRLSGRVEATYSGHLVGNVLDAGGVKSRIATGQFNDKFDFVSRTGNVDVKFDGNSMTGKSSAADLNAYRGQVSGSGLEGRMNGRFVGPLEVRPGMSHDTPAGVVGSFGITDGNINGYRAVGTFAGE